MEICHPSNCIKKKKSREFELSLNYNPTQKTHEQFHTLHTKLNEKETNIIKIIFWWLRFILIVEVAWLFFVKILSFE